MANKLYPPQIQGALPAFYLDYDSSNTIVTGATIKIPFTQNTAVSQAQIACFVLRLRTASTGSYLFPPIYSSNFNLGTKIVSFDIPDKYAKMLNEGQYYKAQIAYCRFKILDSYGNISGEEPGYFSTVGIIKCTSKPTVYINNLTQQSVNFFQNEFIGVYDQSECRDQTEKVYSYEFIVYDEADEVYYTSGEQLHQSAYDTEYNFSTDRVFINDFIQHGVTYSIQYRVTTENNLIFETPKYKLTNEFLASPNEKIEMIPNSNVENGYVTINFKGSLDKDKSQYYILNDAVLEDEKDENGKYFTDKNNRTILSVLQANLQYREERISFLKQNTLFKIYSDDSSDFLYFITNNNPPNKVSFTNEEQIRFIDAEAYQNIQSNDELSEEEKITEVLNLRPYYIPIATGREIVKNLSYKYVDDNHLDIRDYNLIQDVPIEAVYYGRYILSRASDADNYSTWYTIAQFRLEAQTPSSYSFRDMTVEHGRKYKYGLQQTNLWGLISSRIESEPYEVSFEDMFLYDGDRLLKIRFNPKVESFKIKVLEQKTDTIGGRFPYITRNGTTYYKEFPIGGMIACEMDEDQMFHKRVQGVAHRHSTKVLQDQYDEDGNLIQKGDMPENGMRDWHMFSDENIILEREFKLAVLDWLNDGKPKLFKSPYEGNYIVRLMENELKPVEELGRMLHTFTSQAYEVAECTYNNLVSYGFVNIAPPSDYVGQWRTYLLNDPEFLTKDGDYLINFSAGLESFTIQDLMPGDMISLLFDGESSSSWENIMIGITGSYSYTASADKPILAIKIHPYSKIDQTSDRNTVGILNCYYQGARITAFDSIIAQQLRTIPSQQYIGYSPWVRDIKYTNWSSTNNAGMQQLSLKQYQRHEFMSYNFRDYLDDVVNRTDNATAISYKIDKEFAKYVYSFDPGELLDRINATICKGEAYKIQLLNIEQAKFRVREIIPVYTVNQDMTAGKRISEAFEHEIIIDESDGSYRTPSSYQYVSTSPYGYPHPIEELSKYEMIDPYCIYEVFELDAHHNWYPVQRQGGPYYDAYYRTWLRDDYDPTVKINYNWKKVAWIVDGDTSLQQAKEEAQLAKDWGRPYDEEAIYDYVIQIDAGNPQEIKHYYVNNIGHKTYVDDHFDLYYREGTMYFSYGYDTDVLGSTSQIYYVKEYDTDISLTTIKEKNYTELKDINSIHIGNGVIAELTFQIKVIDYYTEQRNQDVAAAKEYYLARKRFYDQLMISYANIQRADYYRIKSRALKNAYNAFLTGTTVNKNYLSEEDKKIIRILLANNYEVEQLKLLKLYNVKTINSELDSSAIQALVKYKEDNKEDEDGTFGTSRVKLYEYESGGIAEYYALDMDKVIPLKVNNQDSNTKTIYRQIDSSNNEVFYSLDKNKVKTLYSQANSTAYVVYNNLSFTYDPRYEYTSENINKLVRNKEVLASEGIYVYELKKVEESAIVTEYALFNDTEAGDFKSTDNYIYMEEVPYSNDFIVTTFFERKELEKISTPEENYDLEGIANKVRDLQIEVDGFNNQISTLSDLIESETNSYFEVYNNMKAKLDDYNTKVYKSWAYQEICRLIDAGESWAAIYSQFNANKEEIASTFEDTQNKIQNYIGACSNLYYIIKNFLPMIDLYNKMTQDGVEEDNNLDEYLNDRILYYRGTIIIAIVAMYKALQEIKNITDRYPSFVTTVYPNEIRDCFDKYNEIYGMLVDNSSKKLLDKYSHYVTEYYKKLLELMRDNRESLDELIRQEETYTDPVLYAEIINQYEDAAFLYDWMGVTSQTPVTILNSDINETYVAYGALPYSTNYRNLVAEQTNEYFTNQYSTYFNYKYTQYYDSYKMKSYNDTKDIPTYHYRTSLRNPTDNANQALYTTFIFYPLAEVKDNHITDNGITSNIGYFNSRPLEEKEQILEVSTKLNNLVVEILEQAITTERNNADVFKNNINTNYLTLTKPYNVDVLNTERNLIINPPKDPLTNKIVENEINIYNNKVLMAQAQLPKKNPPNPNPIVTLGLSSKTREFFKVSNRKAQSLICTNLARKYRDDNPSVIAIYGLSDVYTNENTGEQTILEGYYKDYIDYLTEDRLVYYQNLLLEANRLLKLYQQQYSNYLNKYNKYNEEYLAQQAIYDSYVGTEVMDYYLNPGERTMESIRQEVKEAWWAFLSLLDDRYTKEKERGMYV